MTVALKATIKGTIGGLAVENVIGVYGNNEPSTSDAILIAEDIHLGWAANIMDRVSDQYSIYETEVVGLTDPTVGGTYVHTDAGSRDTNMLPTFVVARVNWTCNPRGRAYRGRTGISGISEDDTNKTDPNHLNGTALGALETAVDDFLGGVHDALEAVGTGYGLAVVSTVLNGAPRVPPLATPITGYTVSAELGTRRKRM